MLQLSALKKQNLIWVLGFGYFFFYIPYASLTKATTNGLIPGVEGVTGTMILPISAMATLVALFAFLTVTKWWRYLDQRTIAGISLPVPRKRSIVAGVATAVIIGATTMAFSFEGVSIVFSLVLMRGGVLIIGRIHDAASHRKVAPSAMLGTLLTLAALFVLFSEKGGYAMTLAASLNIMLYLGGYAVRFHVIGKQTKTEDQKARMRYFVEEAAVALPALVTLLAVSALLVPGPLGEGLRSGFTGVWTSPALLPAIGIGVGYACLYVFGTMIYLDAREYTFCVPINRAASIMSGVVATYFLSVMVGYNPVSIHQLIGAGLLQSAILVLATPAVVAHFRKKGQTPAESLYLFVCNGNRLRSPMAQALCRDHFAQILGVSPAALSQHGIRVESAGLTASPGSTMKPFGDEALTHLGLTPKPHAAKPLTQELLEQADHIFVMTQDQRAQVLDMDSKVTHKVHCLDGRGDIDEPTDFHGALNFGQRVQQLICEHLPQPMIAGQAS